MPRFAHCLSRCSHPLVGAIALLVVVVLQLSCGSKKSAVPTAPTGPSCSLSTTSLDFGSVPVGATFTLNFLITNAGSGTLAGTCSISSPGFSIVGASSYSLTAGQTQSIVVRFAPSTTGNLSGSVSTGCTPITCTGVGTASPYDVSPETLSFGRSRPDQRQSVRVHNTSATTLYGTMHSCPNFAIYGDSSYAVAPGSSASVQFSFQPTASGPQICQIQTGLPYHPSVLATGFGQLCNVSPIYLDLGDAWHSIDQSFTITDTDSFPISGTVTPCGVFRVLGTLSYALSSGQSQSYTVQLMPGLSEGTTSCAIGLGPGTCSSVTPNAVNHVFPTAYGGCANYPSLVDFGTLTPGQTASRTIQVIGNGGPYHSACSGSLVLQPSEAELHLTSPTFSGLLPGDTTRVAASFSSTRLGTHHVVVMVTTNDGVDGPIVSGYIECRATVASTMPYRTFKAGAYR